MDVDHIKGKGKDGSGNGPNPKGKDGSKGPKGQPKSKQGFEGQPVTKGQRSRQNFTHRKSIILSALTFIGAPCAS